MTNAQEKMAAAIREVYGLEPEPELVEMVEGVVSSAIAIQIELTKLLAKMNATDAETKAVREELAHYREVYNGATLILNGAGVPAVHHDGLAMSLEMRVSILAARAQAK